MTESSAPSLPDHRWPPPSRALVLTVMVALFAAALGLGLAVRHVVRSTAAQTIPGAPGIDAAWLPGSPKGLSLEQVVALDRAGAFVPLDGPESPPALNRHAYEERWFRFTFAPRPGEGPHAVLDVILRTFDLVTLYTPGPAGWTVATTGSEASPRDPRKSRRWTGFDLRLPATQPLTVYLHARDQQRLPVEFNFWADPRAFAARELFVYGRYIGYFSLWIGMLAWAVFLHAMLRREDQYHYVLYIIFVGLLTWQGSGLWGRFYAWPLPWLPPEIVYGVIACLALHRLCLFARHFLETPTADAVLDRRLRFLQNIAWVLLPTLVCVHWPAIVNSYFQAFVAVVILVFGFIFGAAVRRGRAGCRQAPYLMLTFAPWPIALIVLLLTVNDQGRDELARVVLLLANALQLILLTLATAFRQRMLLDENLRLQRDYTTSLENEVEQRTRELKALSHDLRSMVAERDRILAIIGHDLRGPASSLQTLSQLLAEDPARFPPAELGDLANGIARACVLHVELLNNLLAWGGAEAAEKSAAPPATDVHEAAADVLRLLGWMTASKHIVLINTVPPGCAARIGAAPLQTILRNLVVNAVKFTPSGGRVTIEAKRRDSSAAGDPVVEITVHDTGVGIPPERLPRLMEGLIESAPGTEAEKGAGLGLTLCRDLARAAGGDIRIESTRGAGTTVFVTLPLARPE